MAPSSSSSPSKSPVPSLHQSLHFTPVSQNSNPSSLFPVEEDSTYLNLVFVLSLLCHKIKNFSFCLSKIVELIGYSSKSSCFCLKMKEQWQKEHVLLPFPLKFSPLISMIPLESHIHVT